MAVVNFVLKEQSQDDEVVPTNSHNRLRYRIISIKNLRQQVKKFVWTGNEAVVTVQSD
jgi:hypothetical protein